MRLDKILVERGHFPTRQKAQYAIEKGLVIVNSRVITKPAFDCKETDNIELSKPESSYVSRGGFKLEKAIKHFNLSLEGSLILDIGASTGGFTDCCLQHGAKKVYSVDSGSGQLDQSLLSDDRVVSKENMNFRYAKSIDLDSLIFDYVVIDVSFISVTHIIANLSSFIDHHTKIILLIKPQFELYEEAYAHKGLIKGKEKHLVAINKVIDAAHKSNLYLHGLTFSPIQGEKKGNIEYLALLSYKKEKDEPSISNAIEEAHKFFS